MAMEWDDKQPYDEPEVEAGQRQADCIEDAEQEAYRALTPKKAGQGGIDFGGQLAQRAKVAAWQPAVAPGDDIIPIPKQVEGHHRRYDQQR